MLVFAVAAVKLGPDWAQGRKGLRPARRAEQHDAVSLLRGRPARRGDDAVRGLLLLVGRGRGAVGAEGHRPEPDERDRRLRARRHIVARADDRRRDGLPRPRDLAGASRDDRARRRRHRSARSGLLLALVGILFAVGGASIDTVFSGAYNLAQFCGWEWGRYRHPKGAPRFTLTWLVLLVLRDGDRHDRRRPGRAHRVRGHLLGRRPAADLPPDPAGRERPRLHGPLRQRPARERARGSSTSS